MKSLNHIYRTIWSEALGAWIAVSEITKTKGKRSVSSLMRAVQTDAGASRIDSADFKVRLKPVLFALACCFAINAQANPAGGFVVNGQASFNTSGNTLTVTNTPGTIINWQGFSIGANEVTHFAQQSASSTVLNHVVTNNPSVILGTLSSNGQVYLVNANGIMFGAGSTVDVAGLVATTLNLSDADFLAGRHNYTAVTGAGNVSNAGNMKTQQNGFIYLIAPNVDNTGIITAPHGEILLAAGSEVQLVNGLDPSLRVNITAPAGNVTNLGQLIAESGSLGLFGTMVKNSGSVSADSAVMQGGKIVFKASKAAEIGGTVSATGTTGGEVEVLGDQVGLVAGANIDASGNNGGGTVLVGGDAHGANANVQNSQFTYVDAAATIKADATQNGDGGKVVVWSDNVAQFSGNISAKGGAQSGNGGWVEVSGKQKLSYAGLTNTLALNGVNGTLLLDPADFIIAPTSAPVSDITGATLASNLALGNVTITTALTGGMGSSGTAGDIIVNDMVAFTGTNATTLTFNSYNNIAINAPITSTVGALNISLNPGIMQTGIVQTATISANVDTWGGTLSVGGSNLLIINAGTTTLNSNNSFNKLTLTGTGTLTGSGNISIQQVGTFNWSGGTLAGTGTFTTSPGATGGPATTTLTGNLTLARAFVNGGTTSQGGAAMTMTVTSAGSLTNNGSLTIGNGSTGGTIIVNGTFTNGTGGTLTATGTGASSVDATGSTVGTIINNGIVSVSAGTAVNAGATLNWTAGQTATSVGTWNIGSISTPTFGGILNLGEAAGTPAGATQTYNGAFVNIGTVNVDSGVNIITASFANHGQLQFGKNAAGTNSYNGNYSESQITTPAIGFMPGIVFASGTNSFATTSLPLNISSLSVNGGVNSLDSNSTISNLTLGPLGTLTGLGNITVTGAFNWVGGTLATTGTGGTAATITLGSTSVNSFGQNSSNLNLNRALINNGVISEQSVNRGRNETLNIGAGGSFTNNGTFNLGNVLTGFQDNIFTVNVSESGIFTNSATTGIINVAGSGNVIQATLGATSVGTISNNGAIYLVSSGSTLDYLGGQTAANVGSFTTVAGSTLNLGKAASAPSSAVYSYSGPITNAGSLNFTGNSNALASGMTVSGTGLVSVPVGSVLSMNGAAIGAPLTNDGSILVSGTGNSISTSLTQNGLIDLASGSTLATPSFINTGTLSGSGTLVLGPTNAPGSGTLTNNGIIAPGSATQVGIFTINGNLVMGPTGSVSMDVVNPTVGNFDVLNVNGAATLTGGTLNISGATVGTYINILNASGGFGSTKFAAINSGFSAQTPTYTANALTVDLQYSITDNQLSELVKDTLIAPREEGGRKRGPRIAANDARRATAREAAPATVCR